MGFIADAILVIGCTIGGLAVVVGFFQTLFGGVWGGFRNMANGAVVVFCALVLWAFISPTPAEPVDMSGLTRDEQHYLERWYPASERFVEAANKFDRLVESTTGMVTGEQAERADAIDDVFYESWDSVQWAVNDRFYYTFCAFGSACQYYQEAARWFIDQRDADEAWRKIVEGHKEWEECLRQMPAAVETSEAPEPVTVLPWRTSTRGGVT
jgi:hypothetical protein